MTVKREFALEPHEAQALEDAVNSPPWRGHIGRLPLQDSGQWVDGGGWMESLWSWKSSEVAGVVLVRAAGG
jgi:hypothetical protein